LFNCYIEELLPPTSNLKSTNVIKEIKDSFGDINEMLDKIDFGDITVTLDKIDSKF